MSKDFLVNGRVERRWLRVCKKVVNGKVCDRSFWGGRKAKVCERCCNHCSINRPLSLRRKALKGHVLPSRWDSVSWNGYNFKYVRGLR